MGCLVCTLASEVGALCRGCVRQVLPPSGLIPEHLRSTVPTVDADAWLVDGFGQIHAVAPRSTIGRSHDNQIVVLSGQVSRGVHAELTSADGGWTVRDMGSHNGVLVNGTRIKGRAAIAESAILKVGDVAMWFLVEIAGQPANAGMPTLDANDGMVNYVLTPSAGAELRLVGTAEGGVVMKNGGERRLPQVEFQLFRILCARAVAETSSPSTIRGCVSTAQLAADLPFQTRYPNDENVRQAVRRLRTALAEVGINGIIDVQPGRGYFLGCPVRENASPAL